MGIWARIFHVVDFRVNRVGNSTATNFLAEGAEEDAEGAEKNYSVNPELHNGADELLAKALDTLDEKAPAPMAASPLAEPKDLVELFAPLRRQFTDDEVDTLFSRNRSTARASNQFAVGLST